MYHCPFQGKSLVDDVGEVGFRSDSHISSDSYKGKFKPCFYDLIYVLGLN